MLAIFRNSCRGMPQKFVAPPRTVTANNIDFGSGASDGSRQIAEQIEKLRIQCDHVARAVIPQEVVELIDRVRKVGVSLAVNNADPLVRVQVVEQQTMLLRRKARSRRYTKRQKNDCGQHDHYAQKSQKGH